MSIEILEFEEPIGELLKEIEALELKPPTPERKQTLETLRQRVGTLRQEIYSTLTPWQQVLVARHPSRPHTLDYVERIFSDFTEIHGDRRFGDDPAIVCGLARFGEQPVLVVGNQKGRGTREKIRRNFGYAKPEGYRKALRAMQLAEKFHRPIIVFVDTPAAYPGIGSEERGVAEAIATNLREMAMLRVPVIVIVSGEGGSGGALGLAIGVSACSAPAEPVALADDVVVIDVRTPAEFASGHLEGAVNIDVQSADFEAQITQLDPDGSYYVYCRSGNRSGQAIDRMAALGFTDLTNGGSVESASAATGIPVVAAP